MKYRAEIDGLRAIALLPVILFHAGFKEFSGGFVGVDVFFVISGYLITSIIINELAEGKFSIVNFYERRARRILPALFLVMLLCIPFAWFWLIPNDLSSFGSSLVAVTAFSSNVLFMLESGYFDTAAELKPLLHTWSLAVEEQYYILFPPFLLLTWRLGIKPIILLLVVVFAASLGMAQWGAFNIPSPTFFLLPTRGWELLVGVFSAFYLTHKKHFESDHLNQLLSLLGFFLIIYSVIVFDDSTPFPSLYTLIPTLGTALLIFSAVPNTFMHKILGYSPVVGVGLISYSAYLWHQPILAFARHRSTGEISSATLIVLCLSSLVMAYISWRWIERPFRDKSRVSRQAIFKFSFLGMISFICLGLLLAFSPNNSMVKNPQVLFGDIGHDEFHRYVSDRYALCQSVEIRERAEVWNGFTRCQQTDSEAPVEIALFGDSHAEHLFLGLSENLGANLLYLIRGGDPFLGEDEFDYLLEYIRNTESIQTVIYNGRWHTKLKSLGEEKFKIRLESTISFMLEHGKQVVLVADVPDFNFDASQCYYKRSFAEPRCDISIDDFNDQSSYLKTFSELSNKYSIEVIELGHLFCDELKCSMLGDGSIYYRDNDHLNIPASKKAGAYIVENSKLLVE